VALPPGTYTLGPDDGTLAVRTERTGAAAMAGHNLLLHVTAWEATLAVAKVRQGAVLELRTSYSRWLDVARELTAHLRPDESAAGVPRQEAPTGEGGHSRKEENECRAPSADAHRML